MAEEPGGGAEGVERLPAVSGPSGECKAPRCSNESVCRPREAEQLPRVTEPAGSCAGTQTHQGPPEGCLNTQALPASRACSSLGLWLSGQAQETRLGTWCSTHSTVSPPLLHPRRTGGDSPWGCEEKPQAPTSGITHDRLRCGSCGKNTWAHTRPNGLCSNSPARGPQADALHTGGRSRCLPQHAAPPSSTSRDRSADPHPHGTAVPITTPDRVTTLNTSTNPPLVLRISIICLHPHPWGRGHWLPMYPNT